MFWYVFLTYFINPVLVYQAQFFTPDEFTINAQTRVNQHVWNASYPRSIEKISDEALSMDTNTTAVISSNACNQYRFECTPVFQGEHRLQMQFRTTRSDFTHNPQYGIRVELSDSGLVVRENGRIVAQADSVHFSASDNERVLVCNYAGDYTIQVGCAKIFRGHTTLPASDAIVLQTTQHSSAKIHAIVRNNAFDDLKN